MLFSTAVRKKYLYLYPCSYRASENVPSLDYAKYINTAELCMLVEWVGGVLTLHLILASWEEEAELTTSES